MKIDNLEKLNELIAGAESGTVVVFSRKTEGVTPQVPHKYPTSTPQVRTIVK